MYVPFTYDVSEAVSVAGQSVAAVLTALIWSRPLRSRAATILFVASVWMAAFSPIVAPVAKSLHLDSPLKTLLILQASATLATIAAILNRPRWFGALAFAGQAGLFALARYARESDHELAFAHLFLCGLLFGVHALRTAPPLRTGPSVAARTFRVQDLAVFVVVVGVSLVVTNVVFERVTFNGDEIANSFQADVYGHLRAYASVPPCPSMFENYWVFHHQGRAFSQYTPGWPLFMAPFQRLGIIWLAGPVMAGIAMVGVARLSRRIASGLGSTREGSKRLMRTAGLLGVILAMLSPSMLLNAGSRFSHVMVCACFVWAVESLAVISEREISRRTSWWYGAVLGTSTSLGVATRPADGVMLGVGVFLYFAWALSRRKIRWPALLGTLTCFAIWIALVAIILRLQLGTWFKTAYSITGSIHPEGELRLSWPRANELKYAIPLAVGSYCWWPAAPSVGIAGLVRALGGRERRVAFMLATSAAAHLGFYFFVEFGRGNADGVGGPRYLLPLVVVMAVGGAGILAPLVESVRARNPRFGSRIRSIGPAILATFAVVYGAVRIAPLVHPLAYSEYRYSTTPMRIAKRLGLKNAIVAIVPGRTPAHETNMSQNWPMERNPDVLYLIRRSESDEVCAREHFPGRTWYRAGLAETLEPY